MENISNMNLKTAEFTAKEKLRPLTLIIWSFSLFNNTFLTIGQTSYSEMDFKYKKL